MALKYKLKEAPSPNLAKQTGAKIGDVSYSKDGDTKFVVNSIDKETGQIGWKVIELPAFDKLNDDVEELVSTAKGVYTKTKSDEEFRKIYEEARLLRNKIRKHLRNEYPDEYKRMTMEGEIDEASMSGAAGAYNTPYAFVRKKLQPGKKKKKKKSKYKMKMPSGMVSSLGYTMGEGKLGDGADLGPGPKAGPDGVTDSAYTKQFKYKLVPKNKDGTYVQKGAGMIVKKLF
jgi:hypothetical protein|tara:strand:+ start:41 stop:730 length:690 start_codon:yes stop_codon:yes gene_type:complete